jgi:hypothetical protein
MLREAAKGRGYQEFLKTNAGMQVKPDVACTYYWLIFEKLYDVIHPTGGGTPFLGGDGWQFPPERVLKNKRWKAYWDGEKLKELEKQ